MLAPVEVFLGDFGSEGITITIGALLLARVYESVLIKTYCYLLEILG